MALLGAISRPFVDGDDPRAFPKGKHGDHQRQGEPPPLNGVDVALVENAHPVPEGHVFVRRRDEKHPRPPSDYAGKKHEDAGKNAVSVLEEIGFRKHHRARNFFSHMGTLFFLSFVYDDSLETTMKKKKLNLNLITQYFIHYFILHVL